MRLVSKFTLNSRREIPLPDFIKRYRDEILTRNKFLEEEAKRKAEAEDEDTQQSDADAEQDDFYDSDTKEK